MPKILPSTTLKDFSRQFKVSTCLKRRRGVRFYDSVFLTIFRVFDVTSYVQGKGFLNRSVAYYFLLEREDLL